MNKDSPFFYIKTVVLLTIDRVLIEITEYYFIKNS